TARISENASACKNVLNAALIGAPQSGGMGALPAYDQGLRLSSAGRYFEAIEYFERALAESPSDTRVLFALGNTASQLGQPQVARQFFAQVLALDPHRLEAVVNLANLLRSEGQFEAAALLLRPALSRNPNSPELLLTLGSVAR